MLLAESIISLPWGIKLSVYGNGLSPEKSIQGFEFEQPAVQRAELVTCLIFVPIIFEFDSTRYQCPSIIFVFYPNSGNRSGMAKTC